MQGWFLKKLNDTWVAKGARFLKKFLIDKVAKFLGRRGVSREFQASATSMARFLSNSPIFMQGRAYSEPLIQTLTRQVPDLVEQYTETYLNSSKLRAEASEFISKEIRALSENELANPEIRSLAAASWRQKGISVHMLSDVVGDQGGELVTESTSIPIMVGNGSNGLPNGGKAKVQNIVVNDYLVHQIREQFGEKEASRFVQMTLYEGYLLQFFNKGVFPQLKDQELAMLVKAGSASFLDATLAGVESQLDDWARTVRQAYEYSRTELYPMLNFRQKQLVDHLLSPSRIVIDAAQRT